MVDVVGRLQISKGAVIIHANQDDFPLRVVSSNAVDEFEVNPGGKSAIKPNDRMTEAGDFSKIGRNSIILFLLVKVVDVHGVSGHNYWAEAHKVFFQVVFEARSGDDGEARLDFSEMVENV